MRRDIRVEKRQNGYFVTVTTHIRPHALKDCKADEKSPNCVVLQKQTVLQPRKQRHWLRKCAEKHQYDGVKAPF